VLNSGVSASGKMMKSCWQWCFSNGKEKAKQLLDGVVSSMKNGEEMADCSVLGVGKIKSVEQWCFSIGKNNEKLLEWCFSNRKEKAKQLLDGVVSSMKNGEEMGKMVKGFDHDGGLGVGLVVVVMKERNELLTVVFRHGESQEC
jgi:uncharacterized protein YhfF